MKSLIINLNEQNLNLPNNFQFKSEKSSQRSTRPNIQKDISKNLKTTNLFFEQKENIRPQTSIKKKPFYSSVNKFSNNQPEKIEKINLKKIKKEIQLNKSKSIHWDDSSNHVISYPINEENNTPRYVNKKKVINDFEEDINIESTPKAVSLISTTAGVLDFIGIPDSLTFIR